jgi:uncharacterized caspase-like protein
LPELSLSLIGEFYLRGNPLPTDGDHTARSDFDAAEHVNTITGWDAFLAAHPEGLYSTIARERRAALVQIVPKPAPPQIATAVPPPPAPVLPALPQIVPAANRYALLIGNSKYPDADAPLKTPVNDMRVLADELRRDGFDVSTGENLTRAAMDQAFRQLYAKLRPGSTALIFFAGFGLQSQRQSYLIPVDAQIWTEADVRHDGVSLEAVVGEIANRGAGVKIALIDAGRRNPYERRFRTFSAGLAPVLAPNGTLVMYSTALSSIMNDGDGDRGLFVQELLKEMRVQNLSAEEVVNRARVGITRTSGGEQVPWISSSLAVDFYFSQVSAADSKK